MIYIIKPKWWVILLDVATLGGVFIAKWLATAIINNFSGCIFRLGGYLCPACGGTRAVYNFLSGNFAKAFSYNPYIVLILVYLIVLLVILNVEFLFGVKKVTPIRKAMVNYKTIIALVIGYALFGIIRNFI